MSRRIHKHLRHQQWTSIKLIVVVLHISIDTDITSQFCLKNITYKRKSNTDLYKHNTMVHWKTNYNPKKCLYPFQVRAIEANTGDHKKHEISFKKGDIIKVMGQCDRCRTNQKT